MKPVHCLSILLLAAACGGNDPAGDDDIDAPDIDAATDAPVDSPPIDAPNIDAPGSVVGPSTRFVTSELDIPENAAEAMALGLDIDNKPNDGVDNQLGQILGSIGALAPDLDPQGNAQLSIDHGETILLLSLTTTGSPPPVAAGLATFEGTNPSPPPCASPQDQVCRQHLQGTGTFSVGTNQSQTQIVGQLNAASNFSGANGIIVAPISLGGGAPVWLPLQKAKAELTGVSNLGFTGKLGGAISQADVDAILVPGIAITVRASFAADCNVGGTPPSCGCSPGSTGETLRGLFDRAPTQDCQISDTEVRNVLSGFLTPDIDLDGNGSNDAISLGVGVTAVAGEFTPP